ncbi:Two-component response regulator SSK1p [Entomophthora muscae]|uniref:Two-component response regulator SSK1p n=1 Tax=Entomophthora muscae TaxID=34485 RepID=A0ACC2SFR8_9FUNG|nr:Two-component response regulator SSK1p [Entomophthora muscae]
MSDNSIETAHLSQSDLETLNTMKFLNGASNSIFSRRVGEISTYCTVIFIFSATVFIISFFSESYILAWVSTALALGFVLLGSDFHALLQEKIRISDWRVCLIFGLVHLSLSNAVPPNVEYGWFGISSELRPFLKQISLAMLRYSTLSIALLSYYQGLYEGDQEAIRQEIKSHLKKSFRQRELGSRQLQFGINHVKTLAEELSTTVGVIKSALRRLSIRTEGGADDFPGTSPFSMVLDSSFLHITRICEMLVSKDFYKVPETQAIETMGSDTFQLSELLQQVGDLLVDLAYQQKVDLVINDADFAFRKISAYGKGIELHHLLHQVIKSAIFSAIPKSSIEIGVKIPSPAQAQVDPLIKDAERYPFVFQVSYSAYSNGDPKSLTGSLELIRRLMGATITHFEGSDRKTIYVHCNLTLSSSSSTLLHQQFDQLMEFHEETKEIRNHSIIFISPNQSRFGIYIQSCWQLMGASLKACDSESPALNKVLRTLNEKTPQSKQVCIAINGHFPSFQTVVHDLLLRSTGDMGRRSSSNSFSIIYLVSPSEYKKSTHFLETILSQCHSSFYPRVSIILKPIGFRRFASLFVAHAASRGPLSVRRPEPSPFITPPNINREDPGTRNSSPHQSYAGEGDGLTAPQVLPDSDTNSINEDSKPRPTSSKDAIKLTGSPDVASQAPSAPDTAVEKPSFTPLSKLMAKGKNTRLAAKNNKTNAVTKSNRKSRIGSVLAPQMARRPGNNSSSYFPQVQSLPINVLIVEDNPINQKILATFMMKRKIKYSVANDGQEAVEKWKEGGFHIVLMDIQLPVMDGIQATKAIRQIERHRQIGFFSPPSTTPQSDPMPVPSISQPNTPSPRTPPTPIQSPVIIVALTASSLRTDRIEALAAGCNDFLTKPVSLVWLEKKIMEWGCMQALIDVEGWRRLKYSKSMAPTSRITGPTTAPVTHNFPTARVLDSGSKFNMSPEAMLSKLKKTEEKKRASSPSS